MTGGVWSRRSPGRPLGATIAVALLTIIALAGCATPVAREELAREYFNLGNAYFELQDYERSYRYYRRAIELSDTLPAAGFNLARLYLERGENREALDVLERLVLQDPDNTLVRETRAYVLYKLGEIDRAREDYAKLLEITGGRPRIAYNLGLLELDLGEYERAAAVLREHVHNARDDEQYRWVLAEAFFLAGREDEALRELEYYRTLVAERPALLVELADRYVSWDYYLSGLEIVELLPEATLREPRAAWAHARALLLGTAEFEAGAAALERALAGGFNDASALTDLIGKLPEEEQAVLIELLEDHEVELPVKY